MTSKVEIEAGEQERPVAISSVSSKGRGRPIADLVEQLEATHPDLVSAKGLSSAALRAGGFEPYVKPEPPTELELAYARGWEDGYKQGQRDGMAED